MKKAKALEYFGGKVSAMATTLKITTSAIYMWGDDVPELQALKLEKLIADGELTKPKKNKLRKERGV